MAVAEKRSSAIRAQAADGAKGADAGGSEQDRDVASTPGVVDQLAHRQSRQQDPADGLRDDLDDVFARYYAAHPDADGLEVFDE